MTAAACWEDAAGRLPAEITALLQSSGEKSLLGQRLLIALPEWEVPLEGGETSSHTDVLAICRNESGLCVIAVEAKVHEDFGPLIGQKRKNASPGQVERLESLRKLFDVQHFEDNVRYQLLHRTASALLTARDFHATAAVMLVHGFQCPATSRKDFETFAAAMNARAVSPGLYRASRSDGPSLYLAWCEGNSRFLEVELPSAL
ncbi:MAG TPA: hypothetical protein VJW51_11930 [Candidatus Acidoferrales bacterium]|nr:hypothetical protein [Candidatus Acidoferrales bacterium]